MAGEDNSPVNVPSLRMRLVKNLASPWGVPDTVNSHFPAQKSAGFVV